MSASILDSLRQVVTPSMVSQLSGLYGVPSQSLEKGLTAAIPTVLAPLAARADDQDFMSQIFALAKDPANDPSLLDSPDRLLERAKATPSSSGIIGQFQSLLFGNGLSGLTDGLARYAGLKPSTASSLMSLAMPLVLGASTASSATTASMRAVSRVASLRRKSRSRTRCRRVSRTSCPPSRPFQTLARRGPTTAAKSRSGACRGATATAAILHGLVDSSASGTARNRWVVRHVA